MSELAFNYQGERFIPPGEAAYWRVRRIRDGQRGQLDVVRDGDGVPLIVPIEISHDDFRAAVGDQDGRYRLDALTADRMPVDVPPAYVTVPAPRRAAPAPRAEAVEAPPTSAPVTAPFGTWPALPMPATMTGTEYLLAEALRGQVAMFQTLAAALADRTASNANGASQMIGAAADLVRAADGAAMPRRRPEAVVAPVAAPVPVVPAAPMPGPRNTGRYAPDPDDFEDDDEGPAPPAAPPMDEMDGMIEKLGKVMTAVGPAVPHLVALVRGYPPIDGGLRNAVASEPEAAAEACEDEPAPAMTHAMASHMILVHQELGEDGPLFRKVLQRMEPEARHVLIAHLAAMTLDDAVDDVATRLAPIKMRLARRARAQRAERESDGPAEAPMAPAAEYPVGDVELDRDAPVATGLADEDGRADDNYGGHGDEGGSVAAYDRDGSDGPAEPQDAHSAAPVADLDLALVTASAASLARPAPSTTATPPAVPTPSAPSLDAHMMQIARHLSIAEVIQARALIGSATAAERATWIERLTELAPAEAATMVRTELARRVGR